MGPGKIERNGKFLRANRSYEFDTTNDRFVRFLLEELLPDAEAKKTTDGRLLNFQRILMTVPLQGQAVEVFALLLLLGNVLMHFVVCLVLLALL